MTFKQGSLVLIPYPFSDLSAHKKRPVLVLTRPDQLGDFSALPVTSQGYHKNSISLIQYINTGKLPKPSWVRTDRISNTEPVHSNQGICYLYGTVNK